MNIPKEAQKNLIKANEILRKVGQELEQLSTSQYVTISREELMLLLSQCKKPTKEKRHKIRERFLHLYK